MTSKIYTSISKKPRLRVSLKDVDRKTFTAAMHEYLGKQRVSRTFTRRLGKPKA
jgi:hypothetical protein